MPSYSKGYRKRPRSTRKPKAKNPLSKYIGYASMAYKAYQGVQYIKNMINCEVHKYDQESSYTLNRYDGAIQAISCVDIAQGDTDATRTGNSILLKSIYITGLLRNNATTPVPNTRVRLFCFQDTQEISDLTAAYTLADIFETATTVNSITSPLNSATVGRYKLVWNRTFELDTINNPQDSFKAYIPCTRQHIRYNGATSSDIQKSNFVFVSFCDTPGTAGVLNPTLNVTIRTSFYDN